MSCEKCGCVIYADTELWINPLCFTCYDQNRNDRIKELEQQLKQKSDNGQKYHEQTVSVYEENKKLKRENKELEKLVREAILCYFDCRCGLGTNKCDNCEWIEKAEKVLNEK